MPLIAHGKSISASLQNEDTAVKTSDLLAPDKTDALLTDKRQEISETLQKTGDPPISKNEDTAVSTPDLSATDKTEALLTDKRQETSIAAAQQDNAKSGKVANERPKKVRTEDDEDQDATEDGEKAEEEEANGEPAASENEWTVAAISKVLPPDTPIWDGEKELPPGAVIVQWDQSKELPPGIQIIPLTGTIDLHFY